MIFKYDLYEKLSPPDFILCKASHDRIGAIKCSSKKGVFYYNEPNEISFTTYRKYNGELNTTYDSIEDMKLILVPDIGQFILNSINVVSEGFDYEHKECTALSLEVLLGQKYLDTFSVNMGTTESIDGVKLYNIGDKAHSLLHLVLEKFPDWTIGYVSPILQSQERSFEITLKDIYSFLTSDVSEAFECVFIFDSLNMTINVYANDEYGEDTNVSLSYNNLLKQTNIQSSTDDIKTCLSLTGYDDLNVREVNMGFDKIYNFNYFNSLDYFSESLYSSYNLWIQKYNTQLPKYNSLLAQYQSYYSDIYFLEHEKMPEDAESTDWTLYGLVPLQEKQSKYEAFEATYMKSGWGNTDSTYYNSKYLPNHNIIIAIKNQITIVESQIASIKTAQSAIGDQMSTIIDDVSMTNNFSQDDLKELSKYIREQDLSTENYVVTDSMTDSERIDMLESFLAYGQKELSRLSQPQFSFSIDMGNIYAIPDFREVCKNFDPGNYAHVTIRDDYIVKAKILEEDINFYDPNDFSITFGNISKVKKGKTLFSDLTDAVKDTQSIATSVSFNQSYWNKNSQKADEASTALSEGLIAAGNYLKSGDDSELVMDKRGMFINTTSGQYAGKDSIFIGGGRILFTSDAWKTVSEAIGRVDIHGESVFGVLARAMIAGYIQGSLIEATEMNTSKITATDINNGNGTFHVDSDGNLTANSAEVKGIIKAESGYIGGSNGFTIVSGKLYSGKNSLTNTSNGVYIGTDGIALGANNVFEVLNDGTFYAEKGYIGGTDGFVLASKKLYSGKSSISDTSNGVYIGTDGIALGANNVFEVTPQGVLTANSGTIGGATIASNAIHASNNNWWIGSDGSASFKNVYLTGVQAGSNFGTVGWDGNINWGSFGGNSLYGSSITNPFSGTTIPHIESLAVGQITADRVKARALEAGFITADTIAANYATIGSLDAATARIGNLETATANINQAVINNLSAIQINAQNISSNSAEITNLKSASISVNRLTAGSVNGHSVSWQGINVVTGVSTTGYAVMTSTGGTTTIYGVSSVHSTYLYMMCAA